MNHSIKMFAVMMFLLMGGGLFAGITNIEGDRLVLDNASLELYGEHTYQRISLVNKSTLHVTFSAMSANGWGTLILNANTVFIQSNCVINGKGKGGLGGNLIPLYGAGGSYGGRGGLSGTSNICVRDTVYGDAKNILLLSQGQSGGDGKFFPGSMVFNIGTGGYGGAKIIINCTSMTLKGKINADGQDWRNPAANTCSSGGGASGGGIGIIARNLYVYTNTALISSQGGNGGTVNDGGGGGGGGRVIICYKVKNANFTTNNVVVDEGIGGITGGPSTNNGLDGERGSVFFNIIPDVPVVVSPQSNSTSINPPVFKFTGSDTDSSLIYFKLEFSDNNFSSFESFDQYSRNFNWSKSVYNSGETANFTYPKKLEQGKIYQYRVYAFDGSAYSIASAIVPFICGQPVKWDIGPDAIKPKVLTLNNDGVNDYINFNVNNPSNENINIKIFNLSGSLIRQLSLNQVQWEGKDNAGDYVPAGVYLIQIQAGNKTSTGLVNVVK
jgi:gliding motility-associated-like protein